jgi:hypothetical protein
LFDVVERFFAKKCGWILMQQGLRKAQEYQWLCRDFSQTLDAQEIGAGRAMVVSLEN